MRIRECFDPGKELRLEDFTMTLCNSLMPMFRKIRGQGRYEHVGALANLLANELRGQGDTHFVKCAVPRSHVKFVAVDERTVDVEQNGINWHARFPAPIVPAACNIPWAEPSTFRHVRNGVGDYVGFDRAGPRLQVCSGYHDPG